MDRKVLIDSDDLKRLFIWNLKAICGSNKDLYEKLKAEAFERVDSGYYDHDDVIDLYKEVSDMV